MGLIVRIRSVDLRRSPPRLTPRSPRLRVKNHPAETRFSAGHGFLPSIWRTPASPPAPVRPRLSVTSWASRSSIGIRRMPSVRVQSMVLREGDVEGSDDADPEKRQYPECREDE